MSNWISKRRLFAIWKQHQPRVYVCTSAYVTQRMWHTWSLVSILRENEDSSEQEIIRVKDGEKKDCTYTHLCRWRLGWRSIVEDPEAPFEEALIFNHLHVAVNRDSGYVLPILIMMMWRDFRHSSIFLRALTFTPSQHVQLKKHINMVLEKNDTGWTWRLCIYE